MGDWVPLAAFGLALVASLAFLFAPVISRETSCAVSATAGGAVTSSPGCAEHVSHVSLLQEEGPSIGAVLSVPVVVAALPLALRRTRWRKKVAVAAGVVLLAFSVLGAASIGLFYLPSGVACLMVAATTPDPRPAAT
jgi:hypothetical protein